MFIFFNQRMLTYVSLSASEPSPSDLEEPAGTAAEELAIPPTADIDSEKERRSSVEQSRQPKTSDPLTSIPQKEEENAAESGERLPSPAEVASALPADDKDVMADDHSEEEQPSRTVPISSDKASSLPPPEPAAAPFVDVAGSSASVEQAEPEAESEDEDREIARRQAIARRMAAMGGVRMGEDLFLADSVLKLNVLVRNAASAARVCRRNASETRCGS
jgi:hypothetical protein